MKFEKFDCDVWHIQAKPCISIGQQRKCRERRHTDRHAAFLRASLHRHLLLGAPEFPDDQPRMPQQRFPGARKSDAIDATAE
ncbi:hypothetical protein OKW50_006146 [Paraburkholderia youngii]|uniref:hypothetical protein n=1 Tax=Paraburkholderia youngii TaxID=2782701 RepID=UPI003D214A4A